MGRVVKCIRYGKSICVKIFDGWGETQFFFRLGRLGKEALCFNFIECCDIHAYLGRKLAFCKKKIHFSTLWMGAAQLQIALPSYYFEI